jgi:hypothetical protein
MHEKENVSQLISRFLCFCAVLNQTSLATAMKMGLQQTKRAKKSWSSTPPTWTMTMMASIHISKATKHHDDASIHISKPQSIEDGYPGISFFKFPSPHVCPYFSFSKSVVVSFMSNNLA